MIPLCGYIAGITPASLMVSKCSVHGFAPVDHYIRSTLTNPRTTVTKIVATHTKSGEYRPTPRMALWVYNISLV